MHVGDRARDLGLPDQNDQEFRLKKFKGKKVLLSFHPLAWTSVCAEQMKSLEKNKAVFDSLNTIAVGVSVDTVASKKAWAESLSIKNTKLLSDFWPHGKTARLYDLFRPKDGVSGRANVIVDENGEIAFIKVYPLGQLPDIQEIIEKLKTTPKKTPVKKQKTVS